MFWYVFVCFWVFAHGCWITVTLVKQTAYYSYKDLRCQHVQHARFRHNGEYEHMELFVLRCVQFFGPGEGVRSFEISTVWKACLRMFNIVLFSLLKSSQTCPPTTLKIVYFERYATSQDPNNSKMIETISFLLSVLANVSKTNDVSMLGTKKCYTSNLKATCLLNKCHACWPSFCETH